MDGLAGYIFVASHVVSLTVMFLVIVHALYSDYKIRVLAEGRAKILIAEYEKATKIMIEMYRNSQREAL